MSRGTLSLADRKLRRLGIGASEIAAAVGEDPFRSPLDLWLEKTGRQDPPASGVKRSQTARTPQMEWGQRLEGLLAEAFAARHGVLLTPSRTLVHPELPWAFATPDRLVGGRRACLEVQNVGFRTMHLWRDEADQWHAPRHVQLRGQWQCLVGGFDSFHVAALIGGRDDYDEAFDFDPALGRDLVERASRFWHENVLADRAPDATASDRDRELLTRLHPVDDGRMIDASPELEDEISAFLDAQRDERAAENRKAKAQNRLRQLIGDAAGAVGAFGEVRWRPLSGRTAWAKVAAEAGVPAALVEKHTGPAGRRLDVRRIGTAEHQDLAEAG